MNFMSGESAIGVLVLLLLYSGAGGVLINWLTRSRADIRRESREALSKNLALMESIDKLRVEVKDETNKAEYNEMWDRLLGETTMRVAEMNNIETNEVADPARRFVLLPPPCNAFMVLMSLVFAISIYFSIFALILIGVFLSDGSLNVFQPDGFEWTIKVVALSIGLGLLAFAARWASYGAYRRYIRRQQTARAKSERGA